MRPGCASHVYIPLYTPAVQRCPCAVCAILNLLFSRQSFVISSAISRARSSRCVRSASGAAPLHSPVKTVALGSVARVDSRHAPVSARSPKKRLRIRTLKTIKTSRPFAYPPGWDRPSSPGAAVSSTPQSLRATQPLLGVTARGPCPSGGAVPLPPPMPPGPHHGRLSTGPQSGPRSEKE